MFTGIIEELGEVISWEASGDGARLTVRGPLAVSDAAHGDSISVSGVCLTVVDKGEDWFSADVMAETIAASAMKNPAPGTRVNLERAATLSTRLGGHLVQGHIDGTATVLAVTPGERWRVIRFSLDRELAPLVARKGSITLDGVSLTVSAVGDDWFEVSLIPETLSATTLGQREVGDEVNLETDIVARQVQRMLRFESAGGASDIASGATERTASGPPAERSANRKSPENIENTENAENTETRSDS